jgi:hypothetical protein
MKTSRLNGDHVTLSNLWTLVIRSRNLGKVLDIVCNALVDSIPFSMPKLLPIMTRSDYYKTTMQEHELETVPFGWITTPITAPERYVMTPLDHVPSIRQSHRMQEDDADARHSMPSS